MAKSRFPNPWPEIVAQFEDYLHHRGKSTESITAYASTLKTFGKFYRKELKKPGPYVSKLQETDFHVFIEHLRSTKRFAATSINRAVSALRNFSRYALEKRLHKRDIARDLKTYFVGPAKSPSRINTAESRRLVTAINLNAQNGRRDLAMVQMLMQCGLRVGEMHRLSVNDVVLHRTSGHIRVRDEKTRAERVVPLNASVRHALREYLKIRGEIPGTDPLFVSQRGGRISIKTIQYLIKKYLCIIGRQDLSARDLRRHLACSLYAKTHNLPVVQQVLGHRSLATTARYVQATEEEIQAALEQLSENIYHNESQDIGDEPLD